MIGIDHPDVAAHRQQAREFLAKSRGYLDEGDLHPACEKAWGAAAHMAKAVAVAQGWEYQTHADFSVVLNRARHLTGTPRLRMLRSVANELHVNFYDLRPRLDAEVIGEDVESVAELLDLLEPLTA